MKRLLAIALLGGCYAPKVEPGSPCDEASPCPSLLACVGGFCERTDQTAPDAAEDGPTSPACVPSGPEICGDGIDQDCADGDAPCPANDHPGEATDVTAGGTWRVDLMQQTDDLASLAAAGCNADGGRDAFYQVTLTAPEVYAFNTFGSGFDTSLRVFAGMPCGAVSNTMVPSTCSDDACGTGESQLGVRLPAGTTCIMLDQNHDATVGKAVLQVILGGRAGDPVPLGTAQLHGDTCTATDLNNSPDCDEKSAKDIAYWFLACPGTTTTIDANTCGAMAETNYDTLLAIRQAGGREITCDDDDDNGAGGQTCTGTSDGSVIKGQTVRGPGLFWLVVDGFENECGKYRVDTRLR